MSLPLKQQCVCLSIYLGSFCRFLTQFFSINKNLKKMKNKKTFFPVELLSEIVHFIPFNIKWSKIRVYKIFDILIFNRMRTRMLRLKFYRDEVIVFLTDLVDIFSRPIDYDNISCEDYSVLDRNIYWFEIDMIAWHTFSNDEKLSRLLKWTVVESKIEV
ncbi:unnamed protein product [Meloidogyne enterolobii]|uniref:Uncharacterized protein n=1 Tax=Meloidogyne enterolobii TaxID=390850 RepID=A0ACB0XLW2_MELEN